MKAAGVGEGVHGAPGRTLVKGKQKGKKPHNKVSKKKHSDGSHREEKPLL